jgi:hypothetical protein
MRTFLLLCADVDESTMNRRKRRFTTYLQAFGVAAGEDR